MSSPRMCRSRHSTFLFSVLLLFVTGAVGTASAVEVTLPAVKDNSMYEEDNDTSNGAGNYIFTGQTKDTFNRRALIAFDVDSSIPAGAIVNTATLELYMSRGKNSTYDVSLHRLLADWGEGTSQAEGAEGQGAPATADDATWEHRLYPDSLWATLGGDYDPVASATTPVSSQNGTKTWTSAAMAADVQSWLDAGQDFGWILIGDETTDTTARRFNSRTNTDTTRRPRLIVDFSVADTLGACCLPDDSCDLLTSEDCLAQGGVYQGDDEPCTPDPCNVAVGACCLDNGTCVDTTEAACGDLAGTYQGDGSACVPDLCPLVLTPYLDPLPIPPLAVPTSGTQGGVATYDIEMQQFEQQLHAELPPTTLWGYEGMSPGPTILAFKDQPVTVNWINDLRDSQGALRTDHFLPVDLCPHGATTEPRTVVHLHGGHVPADVDGYPEDTFLPGEQVTYVYPNNQQAATIWFHDHALGITRLNVMMGLAGAYVLVDSVEQAINLPGSPWDIPLILQDRKFNADGSLNYPAMWQDHFFGDKVMVNGKVWPFLDVQRGKYRFRVLNGSNSRAYTLKLSTGDPMFVIGTDGGLIEAPVSVDSLTITPGERYQVVIDFDLYSPGTEVVLENSAPAPFPGPPGVGVIPNVMKFIVQGGASGFTDPLPATLRPVVPIPEGQANATRNLILDKQSDDPCTGSIWLINGLKWDDIVERPRLGTTEIWRFINDSGITHPMHMHLVFFQVLDRTPVTVNGTEVIETGPAVPPPPAERGWKDTAPVGPSEMLRVIATFDDYLGKYAYHCHILEHEDHEMMRQFEVVDSTVAGTDDVPPTLGLYLAQNEPNPFSPTTTIHFTLPREQHVSIRVFDTMGRLVTSLLDATQPAGRFDTIWTGRNAAGAPVSAGTYFIELESGGERLVKKAILLR